MASFWFGEQFCVSVKGAKLFKEVQVLFDRPSTYVQSVHKLLIQGYSLTIPDWGEEGPEFFLREN